jgi:hypothetical protein
MRYSWQRKNLLVLTGIRKVRFKGHLYSICLGITGQCISQSQLSLLLLYLCGKAAQRKSRSSLPIHPKVSGAAILLSLKVFIDIGGTV